MKLLRNQDQNSSRPSADLKLLRKGSLFGHAASFAVVLLMSGGMALAQFPPPPPPGVVTQMPEQIDPSVKIPQFEVISVKPSKDNETRVQFRIDGIRGESVTPHFLLLEGFGAVNQNQVSGEPSWSTSAGFDIEAKVSAADMPTLAKLTQEQRATMFQQILIDRFKLKTHRETRELPIYQLTVGKSGSKLKKSASEPPASATPRPDFMMFGPGNVTATNESVARMIPALSRLLDRVIVDKTGLTGKYDYTLQWTPEGAAPPSAGGPLTGAATPDSSAPDIFTAIQEQLGLKLTSAKGPVDVVVIDHMEKPAAN